MNPFLSACAVIALAVPCVGTAVAQNHGPQALRCAPGDRHCQPVPAAQQRNRQVQLHPMRPPRAAMDAHRRDQEQEQDQDRGRYSRPGSDNNGWRAAELHRGGRVPPAYGGCQYVVDDWRGHGLRRPPRGQHWVQVGADYVLVAIGTGIILELFLSQ